MRYPLSSRCKQMFRTLTYLSFLILAPAPVAAAEWRGIVPGRSTRQDVIREFSQCSDSSQRCEFSLPKEDVYITFSGSVDCPGDPADATVLLIERDLADEATLSSLSLKRRRFKKFDPTSPRHLGYQGYLDEKAGLVVKAFNNRVFQVYYFPVQGDRAICPNYYRKPRDFAQTYVEHAPLVYLKCPKTEVLAGELLRFKAEFIRGLSIVLTWVVSAGRIVEGHGRRNMTLDTKGLEGQTITIQIERADSTGFVSADSCKVMISPPSMVATPPHNKALQLTAR
jgi:hypothetical protein